MNNTIVLAGLAPKGSASFMGSILSDCVADKHVSLSCYPRNHALKDRHSVMQKVELDGTCGAHLISDLPLRKGELVCTIDTYQITTHPTYQTIQIGPNQHLEDLGVIAYMNHSCQPNTIVDTSTLSIYALRDIAAGEDLTFFYPSTEWEMDRPFLCLCGAPQCVRLVAGAKYLAIDTLSRYFINQHILNLVSESLHLAASAFAPVRLPTPAVPAMEFGFYRNGQRVNDGEGLVA